MNDDAYVFMTAAFVNYLKYFLTVGRLRKYELNIMCKT